MQGTEGFPVCGGVGPEDWSDTLFLHQFKLTALGEVQCIQPS